MVMGFVYPGLDFSCHNSCGQLWHNQDGIQCSHNLGITSSDCPERKKGGLPIMSN